MCSLLMGREFKPDPYAILLDLDNKDEHAVKNKLKVVEQVNMDQYDAPQPCTPSSGLHYTFYVHGRQAQRIGSNTCTTHKCTKYDVGVKFQN